MSEGNGLADRQKSIFSRFGSMVNKQRTKPITEPVAPKPEPTPEEKLKREAAAWAAAMPHAVNRALMSMVGSAHEESRMRLGEHASFAYWSGREDALTELLYLFDSWKGTTSPNGENL